MEAKETLNQTDKKMEAKGDGSVTKILNKLVASKLDDLTPEGLFLSVRQNLKQLYEEAVEGGFEGTEEEFIRTIPLDELRQMLSDGGKVIDFAKAIKMKGEKPIRKLDLAGQFTPGRTLESLSPAERETVNMLLKMTLGKDKD
jgi:hypothetical protein